MRLVIAEKPSVARAIAAELGVTGRGDGFIECGDTTITWCFGHLLEQADPDAYTPDDVPRTTSGRKQWRQQDLPILPQTWILRPRPDARQQLGVIGRLLKAATEVVHAGDPDREGQLLVDEVLEHLRSKHRVIRLWLSAQDSVSIRRALDDLRDNGIYAGMAAAARARQRADWLIGMNLSRAYTLRAQRGGGSALLTVGRVQTPTLALVVARDREIEAFTPRPYYTIEAHFEHPAKAFVASWKPKDDQGGLDHEGRLTDVQVANAVVASVAGQTGSISSYVTEPKKKAPPLCFALSDITVLASQKFGYSAEQVLQACQALYETHKLTSYPRTDCGYLPEAQHADASAVLAAVRHVNPELAAVVDQADPILKAPAWNDAKVTAHHGIIPTMHRSGKDALSERERNVYELIVRRYLAQFYPDHEYMQTRVTALVAGHDFVTSGKVVTCDGWREVDRWQDDEEKTGEDATKRNQALPAMRPRDRVTCAKAERKDCRTKPPTRFTEGSLVRAMEQIHKWAKDPEHKKALREGDGIGTAATRAAILSDLKRRTFLASQGKQIVSTALGRALIDVLPEAVKSAALTALYERMLKQIELGEGDADTFLQRQAAFVRERVAQAGAGAVTLPASPVAPRKRAAPRRRSVRRPKAHRSKERTT
jgi:DNA topoisomerase-3